MPKEEVIYDIFVSYASADQSFVQPLVVALRERGLNVWYDEGQLRIGDSILRQVEDGLEHSKCFLAIVSPQFLTKQWSQFEVGVALGRGGQRRILPIYLLEAQQPELVQTMPMLAGRVGIAAEGHSIDEIADSVVEALKDVRDEESDEQNGEQ